MAPCLLLLFQFKEIKVFIQHAWDKILHDYVLLWPHVLFIIQVSLLPAVSLVVAVIIAVLEASRSVLIKPRAMVE